jgi:hypothetical protein
MNAKQINTENGFIAVNRDEKELRTLTVCNMTEQTESGTEMSRDNIIDLRATLWDAIRKQGRGFEINIEDVLKIEEVCHKGRYSVEGYKEEINWTIDLLQRHLTRVEHWQNCQTFDLDECSEYGKLDEFLSQFEET